MKNSKGFTLIELLAVITIMGILMLVAIPAVSRTIENSRRDTFMNQAKQYVETVRNAVIADELKCEQGGKNVNVSATTAGTFYYVIATDKVYQADGTTEESYIKQQTVDLMESGGKSSWGNNDVRGVVSWTKVANTGTTNGFRIDYSIMMVDAGNHGIDTTTKEEDLTRSTVLTKVGDSKVYTALAKKTDLVTAAGMDGKVECKLNS